MAAGNVILQIAFVTDASAFCQNNSFDAGAAAVQSFPTADRPRIVVVLFVSMKTGDSNLLIIRVCC